MVETTSFSAEQGKHQSSGRSRGHTSSFPTLTPFTQAKHSPTALYHGTQPRHSPSPQTPLLRQYTHSLHRNRGSHKQITRIQLRIFSETRQRRKEKKEDGEERVKGRERGRGYTEQDTPAQKITAQNSTAQHSTAQNSSRYTPSTSLTHTIDLPS